MSWHCEEFQMDSSSIVVTAANGNGSTSDSDLQASSSKRLAFPELCLMIAMRGTARQSPGATGGAADPLPMQSVIERWACTEAPRISARRCNILIAFNVAFGPVGPRGRNRGLQDPEDDCVIEADAVTFRLMKLAAQAVQLI
eukprot:s889_g6.t1